jgi:RNA polymerase sigma factor (sigma-70 family)
MMIETWRRPGTGERYAVSPVNVERAVQYAHAAARRYVRKLPYWMDREAFTGEALAAVALAAHRYRETGGLTFLAYAFRLIQYALDGEARRQDPVGKTRRAQLRAGAPERPSDLSPLSLDFTLPSSDDDEIPEWEIDPHPGPEHLAIAGEVRARIRHALTALQPRERLILYLCYWDDETKTAIAARMGISLPRVRQIEQRALGKLRRELEQHELS